MSDKLLDEATRLHYEVIRDDRDAEWRRLTAEHDLVPALIERVKQAEAETKWVTDAFLAANETCQAESQAKWEALAERDAIAERIAQAIEAQGVEAHTVPQREGWMDVLHTRKADAKIAREVGRA